jgi:hypothetical protein
MNFVSIFHKIEQNATRKFFLTNAIQKKVWKANFEFLRHLLFSGRLTELDEVIFFDSENEMNSNKMSTTIQIKILFLIF